MPPHLTHVLDEGNPPIAAHRRRAFVRRAQFGLLRPFLRLPVLRTLTYEMLKLKMSLIRTSGICHPVEAIRTSGIVPVGGRSDTSCGRRICPAISVRMQNRPYDLRVSRTPLCKSGSVETLPYKSGNQSVLPFWYLRVDVRVIRYLNRQPKSVSILFQEKKGTGYYFTCPFFFHAFSTGRGGYTPSMMEGREGTICS